MIIDITREQKAEVDRLAAAHNANVVVYSTPDGQLHVRWASEPPVQFGVLIYEKKVKR